MKQWWWGCFCDVMTTTSTIKTFINHVIITSVRLLEDNRLPQLHSQPPEKQEHSISSAAVIWHVINICPGFDLHSWMLLHCLHEAVMGVLLNTTWRRLLLCDLLGQFRAGCGRVGWEDSIPALSDVHGAWAGADFPRLTLAKQLATPG